jgi:hypothetical protein
MGAAVADQMGRPTGAAVKGKIFAQNVNRQRLTGTQLMRASDRLPEPAQISPRKRFRSGVNKFAKLHLQPRDLCS